MGWDAFLKVFYHLKCTKPLGSFAQSMWKAWFSSQNVDTLAEKTVRAYVDYVVQTFRDNNRVYPRYNKYGKLE